MLTGAWTAPHFNAVFSPVSLDSLLERWGSEYLREATEAISAEPDKGRRSTLKGDLRCECYAAEFRTERPWAWMPNGKLRFHTNRNAGDIARLTGLVVVEYDGVTDPAGWRDTLFDQFPYTALARVSASGRGVHSAVAVDRLADSGAAGSVAVRLYQAAWKLVAEAVSRIPGAPPPDESVKSPAGFLYECHDPGVRIRENARVFALPRREFRATPAGQPKPQGQERAALRNFTPAQWDPPAQDEIATALEVLARAGAEVSGGACYFVACELKALGRDLEDWNAWAETAGCPCGQGERASRWNRIAVPPDDGHKLIARARRFA